MLQEDEVRVVSTKVGSLKCQSDSFLTEFCATVAFCSKNNTFQSPSTSSGFFYSVILNDSILFPTGGGQPNDLGFIDSYIVVDVYREKDECIHVIEVMEDVVPFQVFDEVNIKLDWERRFDHMQQHSGQHLLSAIAEQDFDLETLSWALTKYKSYIEINLKNRKPPTTVELKQLERKGKTTLKCFYVINFCLVNEAIRLSIPVTVQVDDGAEKPEGLQNESVIRYISIGKLDRNAYEQPIFTY